MREVEKKGFVKRALAQRESTVAIIIVISVIVVNILQPKFLTWANFRSIAQAVSTDGLFAIGLCFALILGGIELSVGGVAAMTSVITGYLCLAGWSIWTACLVAIAAGLFVGIFNGFMVSKVGLPPFIVTLGMMNLSRGVAYILTKGSPLSLSGYLPKGFRFLATGDLGGIPMLFVIFVIVAVIATIFTKKSSACRNIFFVGSNENAARFSGINVDKVKMVVYIIVALLSTLAGLLSLARFNVATPVLSNGAETTAISAAVVGGTAFTGGTGSIIGTFLGIVLLKVVNSALVMLNVSVYWQNFVQGAILVLAVTMDYLSHREGGLFKSLKWDRKKTTEFLGNLAKSEQNKETKDV
ncbi:MAG: ABC transporter permease [Fusobacteriaceae bacterium]|jgi:ribose transport system permease protein|nr:ABC transporter permease [Fusobacteriaceae bacterium]